MSDKDSLVVETRLTKDQFIRLSMLRHFQRPTFYFNAVTGAVLTAYGLFGGPFVILFVAWTPLLLYILFGVIAAFRDSRVREAPFLKTRYEFDKRGVHVSTEKGESLLVWDEFIGWRVLIECYVLALKAGAILAIPRESISMQKQAQLEEILYANIGQKK